LRRRGHDGALSLRQATDVLDVALSPDVYQMLVVERGWTPREWEQWTTKVLVDQLGPRS
jgi:hypothetical protein